MSENSKQIRAVQSFSSLAPGSEGVGNDDAKTCVDCVAGTRVEADATTRTPTGDSGTAGDGYLGWRVVQMLKRAVSTALRIVTFPARVIRNALGTISG